MFRKCSVKPPEDLTADGKMKDLLSSMKRIIVREKQERGERLESGKSPLTYSAYKFICEQLLKSADVNAIFGHCFLTLEWSLMARADNVTKSHLQHIQWRDDCIVMFFAHSKTDQEGVNMSEPWHIYANPIDPAVCPVLAWAKYVLSHPELMIGNQALFPGGSQYNRFTKLLKKVIDDNANDLIRLGADPAHLGSHIARKGSSTLCTTGCTVSPPYISVCLRAGWSLPGVQSRYLHFQEAGDQYVGRTVTGLNPLTAEFSISPPYFEGHDDEVLTYLMSMIPQNTSDQIKILLKFLVASVLSHRDFLLSIIHQSSRFRSTSIMMNDTAVRAFVKTRYAWDTDNTGHAPRITGVPPHVSLLNSMERLLRAQRQLPETIAARVLEVVENNVVQNGGLTATMVLQVVEAQLQRFSTVGNASEQRSTRAGDERRELQIHYYEGRYHRLPQHFTSFPSLTFANLVTRWLLPDSENNIPAFKSLEAKDMVRVKRGRKTHHEMRNLMRYVKETGVELNVWATEWTQQSVSILLNAVSSRFHVNQNLRARRHGQITWLTVLRSYEAAMRAANTSRNDNN